MLGRMEAESCPLLCAMHMREEEKAQGRLCICSKHPLFFTSTQLSSLFPHLWAGGRLQLLLTGARSHRSECGLRGDSSGVAFGVAKGSSFQELGRVSEEGQTGSADGFLKQVFSCSFHAGGIWPCTK